MNSKIRFVPPTASNQAGDTELGYGVPIEYRRNLSRNLTGEVSDEAIFDLSPDSIGVVAVFRLATQDHLYRNEPASRPRRAGKQSNLLLIL